MREPAAPATVGVLSAEDTEGAAIAAFPFLRALRRAFPAARITWIAAGGSPYAHALRDAALGPNGGPPLLDAVIERPGLREGILSPLRPPPPGLGPYDFLLDTRPLLWPSLAARRIPHGRFAALSRMRRAPETHDLDALLTLLERATGTPARRDLSPLPIPPDLRRAAHAALPGEATRHVGLAPGAGDTTRAWPLDRFLALAEGIAGTGRNPVFLLGPAEAALRDAITARFPDAALPLQHPAWAASGGPSPLATVALAARLAAAVANDGDAGHMIAAAGTPLVSLFGPGDPAKIRPLSPRGIVVRAQDHGGTTMEGIPVEAARAALDSLLSGTWSG